MKKDDSNQIKAYNVSDWTSGYFGDIGGFIAYFSAPGQGEELR